MHRENANEVTKFHSQHINQMMMVHTTAALSLEKACVDLSAHNSEPAGTHR